MNIINQEKIAKIHELVKRGATEGEKAAAQNALDKLLKKYNLTDEYLETINLKYYDFKYATNLDLDLFIQLHNFFFKGVEFNAYKSTNGGKRIVIKLEYVDWVLLSSSYEYFKPHMNKEFRKFCLPLVKKCKSTKTQNARRLKLQKMFFGQYVMKSKIYNESQLETIDLSKLSEKERQDRIRLHDIEGGDFNTQVTTGLYLE